MVILQESDNGRHEHAELSIGKKGDPSYIEIVTLEERRIYERSHQEKGVWVCRFAHAEPLPK